MSTAKENNYLHEQTNGSAPSANNDDSADTISQSSRRSVSDSLYVPFKNKKTFNQRLAESNNIKSRFPNKIPIIVERYSKEKNLPLLDKTKYLVPQELTLSQFVMILRNRMDIKPDQTIYLLVNNKSMVTMSSSVSQIYETDKDPDGFLYMTYASQEMFGL